MLISRRFLLLLLALTCLPAYVAAREANPEIFGEVELSGEPKYVGDSCLVSLVLYSDRPFVEVAGGTPLLPQIAHARLRHRASGAVDEQRRVQKDARPLYALVARQYVLRCTESGKVKLPSWKYDVQVGIYEVYENPYDFFNPYVYKLKRRVKSKITLPRRVFMIEERPKRTTREVLRSGQQVI